MIILTGQQKIRLNKWERGALKTEDFYKFISARYYDIPLSLRDEGLEDDLIRYCINNSIVRTNPHQSINFFNRLPHNRLENRIRLKKAGIIS